MTGRFWNSQVTKAENTRSRFQHKAHHRQGRRVPRRFRGPAVFSDVFFRSFRQFDPPKQGEISQAVFFGVIHIKACTHIMKPEEGNVHNYLHIVDAVNKRVFYSGKGDFQLDKRPCYVYCRVAMMLCPLFSKFAVQKSLPRFLHGSSQIVIFHQSPTWIFLK